MVFQIKDDEITRVNEHLDKYDELKNFLGIDWIQQEILNKEDRLSKHYLFWELLSEEKTRDIVSWLNVITKLSTNNIFNKIINKIKENESGVDFLSFLPEMEVLAFYLATNNFDDVIYEPDLSDGKKSDLKLVKNSTEIFVEITRIFPDADISEQTKIEILIQRKLNEIEGPYYVNLKTFDTFEEADIDEFMEGVYLFVSTIGNYDENADYIYEYSSNGTRKAELKILEQTRHPKLRVAIFGPSGGELESGGRLKFKMMDEVEQLPDGALNVIILDVRDIFTDMIDVEDAILGQEGIRYNRVTKETTSFRKPNGFIHTSQGKKVGLIIGFKEYEYDSRNIFINTNATMTFSKEIVSLL